MKLKTRIILVCGRISKYISKWYKFNSIKYVGYEHVIKL